MSSLISQNKIAVVWDFDKTLIPGYMQQPLFDHFKVDGQQFWREVAEQEQRYAAECEQVSGTLCYLNHVLSYVKDGRFAGLNNALLEKLGAQLEFYPGLPDFFPLLKNLVMNNQEYREHEITLEHYIASTGFTRTIRGSAISDHVDGIWGCEFIENAEKDAVVDQVAYMLDDTSKTRVIFEINKGVNKHPGEISVNSSMEQSDRRIPFENIIYIADGPSDVPMFSVVKRNGGKTYGVYNPADDKEFKQIKNLSQEGRVDGMGEADYSERSSTSMWLQDEVEQIASRIVADRLRQLGSQVGSAPQHIND